MTNDPIISDFVETVVTASQIKGDTNLAPVTLAKLETVPGVVNSLLPSCERAKQDLYLLIGHQSGGNTLHNLYHRKESISVLGLKIDDSQIDKLAPLGTAVTIFFHGITIRGSSRETYNNRGHHHNYRHPGNYNVYRGGRGEFYPGNFRGNYQNNQTGNVSHGSSQQNGQNSFPNKKMLGCFPCGQG